MSNTARDNYYWRCAEHYARALRKIKKESLATHPAWAIAHRALSTEPREILNDTKLSSRSPEAKGPPISEAVGRQNE